MCSGALRFLELPDDATPRSSSSGNVEGTCELTTTSSPQSTLNELGKRIAGSLTSFEVSGDRTREAIAMNGGVYWQIDVAPATDGGSHVVIQRIDTGGVLPMDMPETHVAKVLKLQQCHLSCASEVMAVDGNSPAWNGAADRCLFACVGEPGAPARVAPFDSLMPTHGK
jgi:hypothetical protein